MDGWFVTLVVAYMMAFGILPIWAVWPKTEWADG
jgi:hypothetical protein